MNSVLLAVERASSDLRHEEAALALLSLSQMSSSNKLDNSDKSSVINNTSKSNETASAAVQPLQTVMDKQIPDETQVMLTSIKVCTTTGQLNTATTRPNHQHQGTLHMPCYCACQCLPCQRIDLFNPSCRCQCCLSIEIFVTHCTCARCQWLREGHWRLSPRPIDHYYDQTCACYKCTNHRQYWQVSQNYHDILPQSNHILITLHRPYQPKPLITTIGVSS